jgi:hypothetical protein
MPARRKLFESGTVLEVCTRIHQGLPLTAAPSAQTLIRGLLARAQGLNPVVISHLVFMSNHFHMILVVKKPEDVSGFMEYFKSQSSRLLGCLFGLTGQSWAGRYDSPRVLDVVTLKERLVYLYTNPQQANLVDTIDHYPNLSSWELVKSGVLEQVSEVQKHSLEDILKIVAEAKVPLTKYPPLPEIEPNGLLRIDTAAAFRALGVVNDEDVRECLYEVVAMVRAREKTLINERKADKKGVVGKWALIKASPLKAHIPKKTQPRMLCLGSSRKQRAAFIEWFNQWDKACRHVYRQWRRGIKEPFPALGFPPRDPLCVRSKMVT